MVRNRSSASVFGTLIPSVWSEIKKKNSVESSDASLFDVSVFPYGSHFDRIFWKGEKNKLLILYLVQNSGTKT